MIIRFALSAMVLLAGLAGPADAHSPIKGIGTFYNGLLHPVLAPAHFLVLAAVGLLIGQHAPQASRPALPLLAAVAALALFVTPPVWQPLPQLPLMAVAAASGLAVALALPSRWLLPTLLAALAGGLVALDSAPDGVPPREIWLALAGTALGIVLIVTYVGALAARFARPWQQIAVRALGSWVAASAILVLALDVTSVRPPA